MEHYSGEELETLAGTNCYQEWIAEQFYPYLHGRIMEIGAGIGTMAKWWLSSADELHLVEPAKNLFPALEKSFASCLNVSLHNGTLSKVLSDNPKLASNTFNAVIMINVLEHIEDDDGLLKVVNQMLVPGGYLLVFVPAMPAIYGSLDREFGHYRRYTKAGLAYCCKKAGYKIASIRYFDVLGVFPWWLINRVLHRRTLDPAMAKAYDRFIVPMARSIEKVVVPPFGKNLVVVGLKNGTCSAE